MNPLLKAGLIFLTVAVSFTAYAADNSDPGMQMLRTENYSGAQAYFEAALQKNPQDAEAAANMAKLYLSQGQAKTAVDWAQKAVALAPKDAAYQSLLGSAYSAYIDDVSIFSKLGVAHKMLAAFQQAVALDPNDADARSDLSEYYSQAPGMAGGSIDKANEQIAALDKLDPVKAALARADMAIQKKDDQKAEAYLQTAVKLDRTGNSDFVLGAFLLSQNHFEEAFAAFQDGIQKDPENSAGYYQVGKAAILGKIHIQEGIVALQKYLTMPHGWHPSVPTYKWAHYRLGLLYGIAGDKDNEKAQYEEALKLDPDFKEAKKALASM